jgi:hypothetical protein
VLPTVWQMMQFSLKICCTCWKVTAAGAASGDGQTAARGSTCTTDWASVGERPDGREVQPRLKKAAVTTSDSPGRRDGVRTKGLS